MGSAVIRVKSSYPTFPILCLRLAASYTRSTSRLCEYSCLGRRISLPLPWRLNSGRRIRYPKCLIRRPSRRIRLCESSRRAMVIVKQTAQPSTSTNATNCPVRHSGPAISAFSIPGDSARDDSARRIPRSSVENGAHRAASIRSKHSSLIDRTKRSAYALHSAHDRCLGPREPRPRQAVLDRRAPLRIPITDQDAMRRAADPSP